ncbi:MAG: type IV toxin-antitoxin system AbiEi family antitoxin domain-containing protein [Deltaproteobacteria bacterium]|nr:type IV toxin-antitoxin system AbiEi family antitoxin domain-containing protein [Deltaproteobacteria bacterium]
MDRKKKILDLAKRLGLVRPCDIEAEGIPRVYLYRLCASGDLMRIGRGLYALPDTPINESIALAEVAKQIPNGVICLLSALQFHNLTTQLPHRIWVAIENKKWEPKFDYPPIELVRFTGRAFSFGIEEHEVSRVTVKVYSPAKTVADCFKFRNKIGLDVTLEALRETWRNRKATMDELWEAAKVCRVANVMRPYLEAIV